MSNDSTLFVLGAGAHAPYFLPTGDELIEEIIKNFQHLVNKGKDASNVGQYPDENLVEDFLFRLKKTEFSTIDRWIASNPKYAEIAKAAIIVILMDKLSNPERSRNIIKSPPVKYIHGQPTRLEPRGGNWFSVFFNKLTYRIYQISDLKKLFLKNIKIVTFNYEHFFEYLFYHALVNSYSDLRLKENEQLLAELLEKFRPEHINGEFGEKPNLSVSHPDESIYQKHRYFDILKSASGIFTLGSPAGMHYLVEPEQYSQIFFLGFGYDLENLWRLGFSGRTITSKIYGTAFKMTSLEIQEITELLKRLTGNPDMNTSDNFHIENKDSYLLLRERLIL